MTITSLKFILFIAIVLIAYYSMCKKYRWCVLLIASYVYYFISSGKLTIFLIISTITIYATALLLEKIEKNTKEKCKGQEKSVKKEIKAKCAKNKKLVLFFMVLINCGILIFLKYGNFISNNFNKVFELININVKLPLRKIILPLGISYYTLQAISYVVDVYREKVSAEKNLGKVALFLSFFPQMLEGPIGRFGELSPQLYEGHKFNYKNIQYGIQLMLWGFFKKMVIADRAALYVNEVFGNYKNYEGIVVFMAVMLYTLQIYADFSGCIDIVRGTAQLFGVNLAENFKRPFFSKSIQEFWRRWHITLGAWLREYVFYPISFSNVSIKLSNITKKIFKGNMAKTIPAIFALFFVWFTNGIWHGASWKYIFYGLYYYILTVLGIIFEPLCIKIIKWLKINVKSLGYRLWQIIRTNLLVFIGMLIFRANRLKVAWTMFKSIFTFESIDKLFNGSLFKIGLKSQDFVVIIISVIIMFIVSILQEKGYKIRDKISKQDLLFRWILYYGIIFAIIIFGIYGEGYSASSFIYGQF